MKHLDVDIAVENVEQSMHKLDDAKRMLVKCRLKIQAALSGKPITSELLRKLKAEAKPDTLCASKSGGC